MIDAGENRTDVCAILERFAKELAKVETSEISLRSEAFDAREEKNGSDCMKI